MQTPRLRQHWTTGHIGKRCIEAMSLFARVLNTELQNILSLLNALPVELYDQVGGFKFLFILHQQRRYK